MCDDRFHDCDKIKKFRFQRKNNDFSLHHIKKLFFSPPRLQNKRKDSLFSPLQAIFWTAENMKKETRDMKKGKIFLKKEKNFLLNKKNAHSFWPTRHSNSQKKCTFAKNFGKYEEDLALVRQKGQHHAAHAAANRCGGHRYRPSRHP
ncbi:MAG: hypothetical protein J6T94_08660 [Bacteroidaceae bacterium]|nr:hypothetical protein [Bacteroidaceae bacterium]